MWPELINLLPTDYKRQLRREYFMRLGVLALILVAVILLLNGVMLVPSYIYEQQEIKTQTQTLNRLTTTGVTTQEAQVNKDLATLSQQAAEISNLTAAPTASNAIKSILVVPRTGVTITSFVYTAATKSAPASMQLAGVADTREDLRSFNSALAALPFVTNADLPIGDYAQASNIAFDITLTGSFTPQ